MMDVWYSESMPKPRIAIISFPGNNGDTENLRCFWRNGFDAFVFRWNDSREKLDGVDGYFIGAGFSFEDRGRAGMVAARDPLFQFLHEEEQKGMVIVGHCNGCQMLVESGLIPLGKRLKMCVARNAVRTKGLGLRDKEWRTPGFVNEWIWITRTCSRDRCAASDWEGAMHIPIAHGEGRFVTKDPDLIAALEESDQIAFRYCDAEGKVSDDPSVTLNGSTDAIAGICNPRGNVVAMMPHAERTINGDPYFQSVKRWIEKNTEYGIRNTKHIRDSMSEDLRQRTPRNAEIFIDTIIVNNEERTVEQAARRIAPDLRLKQFRYLSPQEKSPEEILTTISLFNPNKETAYVRSSTGLQTRTQWSRWNAAQKKLESSESPLNKTTLLRRDEPDVGASAIGGGETGVCYSMDGVSEDIPLKLQEMFANPHASTLERVAA
jgi:phosphoribosylformylglycinamidine synthase subunit PurQ / glutaminase